MTHEDNIRRKKLWRLKKSRSDPHLAEERAREPVNSSSPLPPSRNEIRGRSPGRFRKFFAKVPNPFQRSARQSPNPQTTAATSSTQHIPPTQITQDPSPHITPTPEPNIELSPNPRTAEAEHLEPKFVNERITSAAKGLTGIGLVPPIIQNASSAPDNLQSVSDTIYKSSALLEPLKAFNSIANGIADVWAYIFVSYIPT
ncbi:hypothetical protein DEU56DRAFT_905092 [Suillus clintonianus]|uniref:uncharacterized protein n=1 Tax=Suillus clintonianus TaxID=1904413 RepID=UPI001B880AE9|nr:uncharacterized protein DEU56DRAFT_905092 [Suillus clintonianus]KAG2117586.1 hypothetical protein DEU56DRAFT_905092 [Suillus clintonianus]